MNSNGRETENCPLMATSKKDGKRGKRKKRKPPTKHKPRKSPTGVKPETAERRRKLGLKPFNPNSLKGLKMWNKGESGNPNGQRRGPHVHLGSLLKRLLSQPGDVDKQKTKAEELVDTVVRYAKIGDPQFAKMVLDRVDGKPPPSETQVLVDHAVDLFMERAAEVLFEELGNGAQIERILSRLNLEGDRVLVPDVPEKLKEYTRERSVQFYERVAADPTVPLSMRLKAKERADLLLGFLPAGEDERSADEVAKDIMAAVRRMDGEGAPPDGPSGEEA
jgi:hypothetical protein